MKDVAEQSRTQGRRPKRAEHPGFPNGSAHLVSAITVPATARPLDAAAVAELAESIKTIGLLHPLVVRERTKAEGWNAVEELKGDPDGWPRVLVSGHRRLAAVRELGWTHAPVIWLGDPSVGLDPTGGGEIDLDSEAFAGLVEAHENLIRSELTPTQRALYTDQAKRCYLILHPETGHGGDRSKRQDSATCSFVETTAKATGKSPRAVRDDARAGAALRESPEAKAILETAPKLPQDALLKVAKAPADQRVEVAREVVQRAKAPKARRALHPRVAARSKATSTTVEATDATPPATIASAVEAAKNTARSITEMVNGTEPGLRRNVVRDVLANIDAETRRIATTEALLQKGPAVIAEAIGALGDDARAELYGLLGVDLIGTTKRTIYLFLDGELDALDESWIGKFDSYAEMAEVYEEHAAACRRKDGGDKPQGEEAAR